MNRILLIAILVMISVGALLTILQIWGVGFGWDIYFKVVITLGILTTLAALVMVLKVDLGEHKTLKDDNYLD